MGLLLLSCVPSCFLSLNDTTTEEVADCSKIEEGCISTLFSFSIRFFLASLLSCLYLSRNFLMLENLDFIALIFVSKTSSGLVGASGNKSLLTLF